MNIAKTGIAAVISFLSGTVNVWAKDTVTDVHSHIILPAYTQALESHDAALEETFPLPQWDVQKHLEFMDKAGIKTAVLSLPAPQPCFGNTEESRQLIRRLNEEAARIKAAYPGRFLFLAALPLPDVEGAMAEAEYALTTLKADGIKLASNSRGQYIGDAALDPLMAVLNRHKAVVFIHPHRPTPYAKDIIDVTPLAMYEYPAETTRGIVNMLARNVPARYPDVKIIIPHCGSFLPLALPRMRSILPAMVKNGLMEEIDWEKNLSGLYYDLAGNPTPEVIDSLLTITAPDHILFGSDYPYLPPEVHLNNLQRLKAMLAANKKLAPYAEMFLWQNADNLFAEKGNTKEK